MKNEFYDVWGDIPYEMREGRIEYVKHQFIKYQFNNSHAVIKHAAQTDMELCQRMWKENRKAVSTFTSEKVAVEMIKTAILKKWDIVKKRLLSYNKEIVIRFTANNSIGRGICQDDDEPSDLYKFVVVLTKDMSENLFFIKTAYPIF